MTRKELAIEIAKGQIKYMELKDITPERFAFGLLYGCGLLKPRKKDELERWYDRLVKEGYIAR